MNNLVVPAAGRSARFPDMKPKWLLTHPDGQLMIEKTLSNFEFERYDKIIITILQEHCEKYDADIILRQIFGDRVDLCILENQTADAAETIYETIKRHELEGYITVKDSDCYVQAAYPLKKSYVVGISLDKLEDNICVKNKSFIIKNDEDIIIDIVEKRVVSQIICLGTYCLKIESFIFAYNKIRNTPIYKFKNEVYISHIISYLIEDNKIFHFVEAEEFVDWGTLPDWRREQRKYMTYFFDIDGVLLKNTGKYGKRNWTNTFEPIKENIKILKRLSDEGNQIIFTTARGDKDVKKFLEFLQENNIVYKQIITNCFHSQRILINDFSPTNPYPSCRSISMPRNELLEEYLK